MLERGPQAFEGALGRTILDEQLRIQQRRLDFADHLFVFGIVTHEDVLSEPPGVAGGFGSLKDTDVRLNSWLWPRGASRNRLRGLEDCLGIDRYLQRVANDDAAFVHRPNLARVDGYFDGRVGGGF